MLSPDFMLWGKKKTPPTKWSLQIRTSISISIIRLITVPTLGIALKSTFNGILFFSSDFNEQQQPL